MVAGRTYVVTRGPEHLSDGGDPERQCREKPEDRRPGTKWLPRSFVGDNQRRRNESLFYPVIVRRRFVVNLVDMPAVENRMVVREVGMHRGEWHQHEAESHENQNEIGKAAHAGSVASSGVTSYPRSSSTADLAAFRGFPPWPTHPHTPDAGQTIGMHPHDGGRRFSHATPRICAASGSG
jgi:hypothetical protein